jgi:hypothetical protein
VDTANLEDESDLMTLEERLAELRPELDELRLRLMDELGRQHVPDAKVLWKVLVLYQCVIRRTLELVDGVEQAWTNRQYLSATVLARVLVETAAFIWDVTAGLEARIGAGDLDAVDDLIVKRSFGSRMKSWHQVGLPQSEQVLTLIDRMDRDMQRRSGLVDSPKAMIRAHYDLLSEFAHPNWLGVECLYGQMDRDVMTCRFGEPHDEERQRLSRFLAISMNAVPAIEACLRNLDQLAGPLWELNRRVPAA